MAQFGAMGDFGGNNTDINWLKIENNKPVELVLLSHINPKVVGEDNFVMGQDMLAYRAWKPYRDGFMFKNNEDKNVIVKLPSLDESEHDEENSDNPFVDIAALLGVKEQVKTDFLLWVMDANTKEIYLYNPPITVVYELAAKEEIIMSRKKKPLKGSIVTIGKTVNGKKTTYSVTPMFDRVDIDDVEYPCDLREIPLFKASNSIDAQIRFLNSIKTSTMNYLGMGTEDEWPFNEEDMVKQEFLNRA